MKPSERLLELAGQLQQLEGELIQARRMVSTVAMWAASDVCTIDENTPRELRELYEAASAYVKVGYTVPLHSAAVATSVLQSKSEAITQATELIRSFGRLMRSHGFSIELQQSCIQALESVEAITQAAYGTLGFLPRNDPGARMAAETLERVLKEVADAS